LDISDIEDTNAKILLKQNLTHMIPQEEITKNNWLLDTNNVT